MESPPYFEPGDQFASFRPVGTASLEDVMAIIGRAVVFGGERGISRVLINVTGLTGYELLETLDRYHIAAGLAAQAKPGMKVVLVAPISVIDPGRFGVTVAQNRGLNANIFGSESEAVAWLLESI